MDIQIIDGNFTRREAIAIITQIVHTRIRYLEGKIPENVSNEHFSTCSDQIKLLQKKLYEACHYIESCQSEVAIACNIAI